MSSSSSSLHTSSASSPFVGSLDMVISDVYYTTHGGLFKPDYHGLLIDLLDIGKSDTLLPRSYQTEVLRPFITFLEKKIGQDQFKKLFHSSEEQLAISEKKTKKAIEEVAEGLLQRNHQFKYYPSSFRDLMAFQAVVTSIFNDVLEKSMLKLAVLPPLAKWGPSKGPYAFPQSLAAIKEMNVKAGLVNLPPEHRTGGLLAWVSLGHEVAGHHFLHAIDGLVEEIKKKIAEEFDKEKNKNPLWDTLSDYWCACAEEATSDVLGTLNIGPSFGIGLLGYFRGVRDGKLQSSGSLYSTKEGFATDSLILSNEKISQIFINKISKEVTLKKTEGTFGYLEPQDTKPLKYLRCNYADKHPLDVLRPFLSAHVTRLTQPKSESLIKFIEEEAYKDLEGLKQVTLLRLNNKVKLITVDPVPIPIDLAIKTAQVVANALVNSPLKCLEGKKFRDIFQWQENDEQVTERIMRAIDSEEENLPTLSDEKFHARHVIAASVLYSVQKPAGGTTSMENIEKIFVKMKKYLVDALERTPAWSIGQHVTTDSSSFSST